MADSLKISAELAVSHPHLYDLLFDLVVDPNCDGSTYDACEWYENGTASFARDQLDSLALEWASEQDLPWPERVTLLLCLDKLAWKDNRISFHWTALDGYCEAPDA